ncbi:hypothetical protein GCM10020218_002280 [Dactylosporangium vinaceum]
MSVRAGSQHIPQHHAEQTWERVQPLLPSLGITRVADLTGLDDISLPSHAA